jgi:hypothetical protein
LSFGGGSALARAGAAWAEPTPHASEAASSLAVET